MENRKMKKNKNNGDVAVRIVCLALVGMLLLGSIGTALFYLL